MDLSLFGQRLKTERERLSLSQDAAARIADVKRETWSRWENGKYQPGSEKLAALAGYGFNTQFILSGSDQPDAYVRESLSGVDAVFERMYEAAGRPLGVSYAQAFDVSEKELKSWQRKGKVPPEFMAQFAARHGVRLDVLMYGESNPEMNALYAAESDRAGYHDGRSDLLSDFVLVPRYDVRAGAGGGQAIHDDAVVDHLAFKRDWIVGSLDLEPRRVALIEVHGDSMQPTLGDGDLILVDLRNGHMRQPGVYVIQHSGHLLVKRLAPRMDGGVDVISDNPAYAAERLGREAADVLVVIGRVVWSGGKI